VKQDDDFISPLRVQHREDGHQDRYGFNGPKCYLFPSHHSNEPRKIIAEKIKFFLVIGWYNIFIEDLNKQYLYLRLK